MPLVEVVAVSPSATAYHTRGNLQAEALWVRPSYMKQHRRADLSSEEERPLRAAGSAALLSNLVWDQPGTNTQQCTLATGMSAKGQ